jgi:hypothetical protein
MPAVTVRGFATNQITTVPFDSTQNLLLAKQIAFAISSEVAGNTATVAASKFGTPPTIAAGGSGVFFQDTSGVTLTSRRL